jgi:FAH family protein
LFNIDVVAKISSARQLVNLNKMKIFAVGMNYLEHNKELHGSLFKPEEPVIFTKADSAVLKDHKPFFIPDHMGRIDYETEIVVRISKLGKNISERFAHRYYDAVTVGIDFTARELQKKLRSEGKPWDLCKGFDGSAALGEWVSLDKFRDIQALHFHLDINGNTVQEGCTSDMLYRVDQLIAYISQYFTLKTGDILYTGTPAGVGPVHIDDHLEGYIEDRKVLEFNCK